MPEAKDVVQPQVDDVVDAPSRGSTTEADSDQNLAEIEPPPTVEKAPLDDGTATATAKAAEPEYEYITGVKLLLVMASVTLVAFLMMLDMSIIVTAIPRITTDFHSLSDVGWYGSAYLLANCALQPLTGKIYSQLSSKASSTPGSTPSSYYSDRKKYTFLAFLALFELGSVLCGAAQSSVMLIIGRAVAGLGSSGLSNGALTILAAAAPIHKRPALLGGMMSIGQIGIISGPLIGGALTEYATWRWCFYINLPIGAVAAVFLLLIKIPERLEKTDAGKPTILVILSKLDLTGFALFAPFSIMLLLALEWGGTQYPWNSAMVIGLLCGAAGALVLFAAWEYRAGDGAMVPFSMVRRRVVWCSCLVVAFFFGCLLIYSYYLPIYFQAVRGVSPALSGVYVLPGILSQMLMAVVSGVLVGKLGYYLPWSIGSGVVAAIASGLISTFKPDTPTATWVGYQFLAGLGRGCGLQMPIVAIQAILPPEQNSVGMSLVVFSQTFGGTLFLTFAETIFSHSLVDGLQMYAPTVDVQTVVAAGASAIQQVVKPEEVPGVLEAYNLAINHNFYLAAGASVGCFVFCWGMGWYSVKKKKEAVKTEV